MIAHRSPEEQDRLLLQRPMPLGGVATPEEVAVVIGWFLNAANTKVTGQLLFVDGGGEALLRPEDPWAGRAIPGPSDALDLTGREVLQTRG